MVCKSGPHAWQLRILGGAAGAIASAAAAVVTAPTGIGLIICATGIPAAALVGICYAPELLAEGDVTEVEDAAIGLAVLLGTTGLALVLALSQSRGATPSEVMEFGFLATTGLGAISLLFALPMARIVTRIAISLRRVLAPRAGILWFPSALVLAMVAAGTLQVFILALRISGDAVVQAAHLGQP
jgi:hypothetical protein